ncbi:MAG: sodium-independent anion transporter, partial [Bacteroidota bacterium]
LQLGERDIIFKLAGAIGPIRDILKKNGLLKIIGQENIYVRTAEAYADSLEKIERTALQEKVSVQHR